ncbi:glycosyltransferase [Peribacillus tepidiphilus]|uniref:glycosyltransferase n=1 Tax=Peribacillus tepidiphilus TaxID=2652445 RepID=UPI0035B5615A
MQAIFIANYSLYRLKKHEYIQNVFNTFIDLFEKVDSLPVGKSIYLALAGTTVELLADREVQVKFKNMATERKSPIIESCGSNLIDMINHFISNKKIILAATSLAYFPLTMHQTSCAVHLQVREAQKLYEQHFKKRPTLFIFPKGAFQPGLDKIIFHAGYDSTLLDQHSFIYSDPHANRIDQPVFSPHGIVCAPGIYISSPAEIDLPVSKDFSIIADISLANTLLTFDFIQQMSDRKLGCQLSENIDERQTVHLDFSYWGIGDKKNQLFSEKESTWLKQIWDMEKDIQHFLSDVSTAKKPSELSDLFYAITSDWAHFIHEKSSAEEKEECLNSFYKRIHAFKQWGSVNRAIHELEDSYLDKDNRLVDYLPAVTSRLTAEPTKQDSKMKLIMLTWEYPPNMIGGLSRHVNGLATTLASKGNEVHVITAGKYDLKEYELMNGVHVHRVQPYYPSEEDFIHWVSGLNLQIVEKIKEITEYSKPALLHAHDWLVAASAITAKEHFAIPLVSTIHATESGRNNGIHTAMHRFIHGQEQMLVEQSDHIIVCSEYMKNEVKELFSCEDGKISIIPNGIFPEEMLLEDEGSQFQERKMIFSWGRMVPEKGFDILIGAAKKVHESYKDILFLVAGKGPLLETYRRKVAEEGMEEYFHFIGFVNDKTRNSILKECYTAVFPSLYEPFGVVALEAMVAQKPVIVSETGGLKAIIQPGITGMLCKPGDASDLAHSLIYLLSNPKKASSMAASGKKVALKLFSWERVALETERIFNDLSLKESIQRGEADERTFCHQPTKS